MNRKKLVALVIGILVLVAAIVVVLQPKQNIMSESVEAMATEDVQTNEEANTEAEKEAKGEPGEVSLEETKPDAEKMESGNASEETSQPGNNTTDNSKDNAEETKPSISEENVQMGVVPGVDDGGLDASNTKDAPAQNVTPVQPTQPKPEVSQPEPEVDTLPADFDITKLTYEQYNAMSGAQQKQVIDMFGSVEDFMRWYRAVEAMYQAEHPDIEIGADGVINAEDIIK